MSKSRKSLRAAVSLAAILAAGGTSGCLPLFKTQKDVYDVQTAHPISVDADTASLTIPVLKSDAGISPTSERDVRAFLAVYKARGHGPITIAQPVGSSNESVARHVAADVLRLAGEAGVEPAYVSPQLYHAASNEAAAPILISFTRYVASAAPCGNWSHNAGTSLRNTEMPDFGCATQNNFAAMLDDPHDLVAPRGMTPSDAERRAAVYGKYRKGETTITDRKDSEKSDVSKTGGGE